MPYRLLLAALAATTGAAMAIYGTLNAALGKVIGFLESTLVVHAAATLLVMLLLFPFGLGNGAWQKYAEAPWYVYLGGPLAVLITFGVLRTIPVLGVARATALIVLSQVLAAAIIDHWGLLGMDKVAFSWGRLLGALLMGGGAWLLLNRP